MPDKKRPNGKEFREATTAEHKRLFGHIFCRIGGRGFDENGNEIHLDAHHAGVSYAQNNNSTGTDNGLLVGSYCHQEIIHAGHGSRTPMVRKLSEMFLKDKTQKTYPLEEIDCSQCGKKR